MSRWYEWAFGGIGVVILTSITKYVFNLINSKQKENLKENILLNADAKPLDIVEGGFNSPRQNECINRTISCVGWINELKTGQHLWLVIEVGDFLWPKEGEVIPKTDGTWERIIFEDGNPPNGEFSISLYVTNNEAHKNIISWLDTGRMTGNYYGLRGIPGTRRIDRINLKLNVDT